jgi:hypothetical protein
MDQPSVDIKVTTDDDRLLARRANDLLCHRREFKEDAVFEK